MSCASVRKLTVCVTLRSILLNYRIKFRARLLRPEIRGSKDCVFQRPLTLTFAGPPAYKSNRFLDDELSVANVLVQILDNAIRRYCVMARMPTIVVGHKSERGVANLGLAREFRLLQVC